MPRQDRDAMLAGHPAMRPSTSSRRLAFRWALVALILIGAGAIVWRAFEANRAARAAIDELTALANNQDITNAVIAQNALTAKLSKADIARLDAQYRAEAKTGIGLAAEMMARTQSQYLKNYAAKATDRIVFVMVMDARGLNVAASRPTTDYFQADEDKWLQTFPKGPGAVFWDGLERDSVTNRLQHVVSRTMLNPKTGQSIGVISIAFDNEALKRPSGFK